MRRIVKTIGAELTEAHTPQGDLMTVICLDDYNLYDREAFKKAYKLTGLTHSHLEGMRFD